MAEQDRMDITISVIMTAVVAMVILCYVAIPVIGDAINSFGVGSFGEQFKPILTVVVTIIALGIVITVLRGFNDRTR